MTADVISLTRPRTTVTVDPRDEEGARWDWHRHPKTRAPCSGHVRPAIGHGVVPGFAAYTCPVDECEFEIARRADGDGPTGPSPTQVAGQTGIPATYAKQFREQKSVAFRLRAVERLDSPILTFGGPALRDHSEKLSWLVWRCKGASGGVSRYVTGQDFNRQWRDGVGWLVRLELLAIDDVGANATNSEGMWPGTLRSCIRQRLLEGRQTVLSTPLVKDEIAKQLALIGPGEEQRTLAEYIAKGWVE